MLERFFVLIQGQNFCQKKWDVINSGEPNGSPNSHSTQNYTVNTGYLNANRDVKILKTETTGGKAESCDEVCDQAERVCDITSFGRINYDLNLDLNSKSKHPFCDEIEEIDLSVLSKENVDKYGFSLPMVLEQNVTVIDDENKSHNKTKRNC